MHKAGILERSLGDRLPSVWNSGHHFCSFYSASCCLWIFCMILTSLGLLGSSPQMRYP